VLEAWPGTDIRNDAPHQQRLTGDLVMGLFSFMRTGFDVENIRIKAPTPRDRRSLLKLMQAYYRFEGITFNRREIASGLSLLLKHPTIGAAWLILNRGKPVGYFILTFGFDLEFGGWLAGLTDLYIEARHRRKGIGRTALQQAEEFCRSRGVKAIELQVTRKNVSVVEFYRSIGFEAFDRIPMRKRIGPGDSVGK
jgi:GNAT superfamily N-acetyltransferase